MAKASVHPADLLGFGRLAIDGTVRLTDLVQAMHHNIAVAPASPAPARGTRHYGSGLQQHPSR